MQRAPRTGAQAPEPDPNPEWLGARSAHDAILDQALRSGRASTYAALRVLPGTDLQALNRSITVLGAVIEGFSGEYARVRVPADRGRLETIAGLSGVLGIGAIPPGIKADEAFAKELLSAPPGKPAPVYITLMAEDPLGEWRQALTELGVIVGAYDRDLRSYTANLPPAAFAQVVAADFVLSVEPIPVVTVNHRSSVPVMGADGLRQYNSATKEFSGITGAGIAVGVLDTGLNTSHMDVVHGRSSICGANFFGDEHWDLWLDLIGHGSHVFGTIAGAGSVDPLLAGIAPRLSHVRFGKVLSAEGSGTGEDIRRGMDYLARPTSCLWRGEPSAAVKPLIVNMSLAAVSLEFSGRGVGERKLDSVVRAHSQLYVVAQANAAQHGFSNYGTAKNSLAIGAVDDAGILAAFSSHGPTADGRLAPNVVGTGVDLTSVRGRSSRVGHVTYSGTSMAAPSVAGVAALLMEKLPEFKNRPALTRARLMASAIRPNAFLDSREQLPGDNTDGPGDFQNRYGLGLVSARTSLLSRDDAQGWLIGSASSEPDSESYEHIDITVPEGASRLDVVLTWDEQPADTLTRSVLNNLDLWADQGADCAEEACGEHASRSEVDNVEWLLIEDPVPGTYRIKVVPVEIYAESSTAAIAWKILRGDPTPQLSLEVEDTSAGATSDYLTVDVMIDADQYVASGTTLFLGCDTRADCYRLGRGFLPGRSRVYREDGLNWSDAYSTQIDQPRPIAVGEVAVGTPRKVQLWFLRELVPSGAVLHLTASSWNSTSGGHSFAMRADATETDSDFSAPANDSFTGSEPLEGATGEMPANLALASREPGEPFVTADSRTLWYVWEAPATGLFRFRLQEADSGEPVETDFALFGGDSIIELDVVAEKRGNEISFAAQAGVVYRLRIASNRWNLPSLTLIWESADSRPANDDLAYAQAIDGASGAIESTNEGATLESSEFLGGVAATVWYEWTAPRDGWTELIVNRQGLRVFAFVGERMEDLRLVSPPNAYSAVAFRAKQGETYQIAVGARSADDSGADFELSWNVSDENPLRYPDFDLFENAVDISGSEGSLLQVLRSGGSEISLTVESSEPASTGIGTRWWKWTVPSDGRYTWRLDGSPGYRLTLFTGATLEDLDWVGTARSGSAFVLDATADTQYWIAFGRSPDNLDIVWNPQSVVWGPTPANDERTAAVRIDGSSGSTGANLAHATTAPDEPADTVGTDSVWWHWSAPASGWHRFWVEGHPVSTILAVYPDSASMQAIGDSERTFIANGRVEVHLLAKAGHRYEIRLSSRPDFTKESSATVRWATAAAPAFLSYKGALELDSLAADSLSRRFRWPHNSAMSADGKHMFVSSDNGIFALARDTETGGITLAYRTDTDSDTLDPAASQEARLWWNARDHRLFALTARKSYSFALPMEGSSLLSHGEITLDGGEPSSIWQTFPGAGSTDGQHFYSVNELSDRLQAYRVDSATLMTLVQTVSSHGESGDDVLIVPEMSNLLDIALSSDDRHLYVISRDGLFVFTRDTSSGKLQLVKESDPGAITDGSIYGMQSLKSLASDADGNILFVSGKQTNSVSFDTAIAAFDISTDPADPVHLDTLTGMYFENDPGTTTVWNHLQPLQGDLFECNDLVVHADLPAVDIFCFGGYYVVAWDSERSALEVTDFALSGSDDRFGNRLAYHLGMTADFQRQQMAQSPDGAHVYRAASLRRHAFSDAIHIFERASAMKAMEEDE